MALRQADYGHLLAPSYGRSPERPNGLKPAQNGLESAKIHPEYPSNVT